MQFATRSGVHGLFVSDEAIQPAADDQTPGTSAAIARRVWRAGMDEVSAWPITEATRQGEEARLHLKPFSVLSGTEASLAGWAGCATACTCLVDSARPHRAGDPGGVVDGGEQCYHASHRRLYQ